MVAAMTRPVLSVCIPTRNRGETLVRRVREWLCAAPEGLEFVVSDNASTDGTPEALAALAGNRLVFVRGASDVGSFENQLRAFAAAHGRYVMQLTDKDEVLPPGFDAALAALARTDAACGAFRLGCAAPSPRPVRLARGLSAYRRHGLAFAHPSGVFFDRELLGRTGALDCLRGLDPAMRPFSTDFLVALCLRHGAYADVALPFAKLNLPPYAGLARSLSYDGRRACYFAPEFLFRLFVAYVGFLRTHAGFGPLARASLVAHLVRRRLFPQMTEVYRWCLAHEGVRAWYGLDAAAAEAEKRRDLEGGFFRAVADCRELGRLDTMALRLGAGLCRRRARRQRREHGHT